MLCWPGAVSLQGFQTIARKYEQVVKAAGRIKHGQFSPSSGLQFGRQTAGRITSPDAFRFLVLEGSDYGQNNNAKRSYRQDRRPSLFMPPCFPDKKGVTVISPQLPELTGAGDGTRPPLADFLRFAQGKFTSATRRE